MCLVTANGQVKSYVTWNPANGSVVVLNEYGVPEVLRASDVFIAECRGCDTWAKS